MYVASALNDPPLAADLVYHDPRSQNDIDDVIAVDCSTVGQYVTFYLDANNGANDIVINLCEVLLFGMCTTRHQNVIKTSSIYHVTLQVFAILLRYGS